MIIINKKIFIIATRPPHASANKINLKIPANKLLTARTTVIIHAARPLNLYHSCRPPGVGGPKIIGSGSIIYKKI